MDIAYLRQWIGQETNGEDIVTDQSVARFRATLGPFAAPVIGDEAPALLHFCLSPQAVPPDELGQDGHPARQALPESASFLPPVPLPRRMWAGGALDFHAPLRIGDRVHRRSRISDIKAKTGQSGALCFVTVEHQISVEGRVVISERQDIVYRDNPAPGPARAPAAGCMAAAPSTAPVAAPSERFTADPILLFRYSALTFNSHRIHYDLPYATEVEGYPGLVVQGPLQATLLIHFAARLRGAMPRHFTFRSRAPLFAGDAATLQAGHEDGHEDGGTALHVLRHDGEPAMEAFAKW